MRKIKSMQETKVGKEELNLGEKEINVCVDEVKVVTYEDALNIALKVLGNLD